MTQATIDKHMTEAPFSIGAEQTLVVAEQRMREHRVRHLPVLHGGEIVGVVSERDIALVESLPDVDPARIRVLEAMTPDPYVVSPSSTLVSVAAEMARRRLGTALVADGETLLGIFTTIDALRILSH
jgi:acetoin utilization protein AcuB